MQEIGKSIQSERLRAGLTQQEVADRTGIKISVISRLENGRAKNPTLETLNRIAAAIGCYIIVANEKVQIWNSK